MIHTAAALTAGIYGAAIGDALGQATQFSTYQALVKAPVHDMQMGTYVTLPGTWSDDTSMTLATLSALANASDNQVPLMQIMANFEDWLNHAAFTPLQETFDVGNGTREALSNFQQNKDPNTAGSADVQNNGNGALMRMLPISLWAIHQVDSPEALIQNDALIDQIVDVAQLTHRHPRSTVACLLYTSLLARIITTDTWSTHLLTQAVTDVQSMLKQRPMLAAELGQYNRLLDDTFYQLTAAQLNTSGYVVDTLESVWWLLAHYQDFHDLVLVAINLGGDTDTIASIAGGLAAIRGGLTSLPRDWQDALQGRQVIATSLHDALRSGRF